MNWLDIVILVAVGVVALVGWRMGGIQVSITGAGILAGIALSSRFHSEAEPLFSRFIDNENGVEFAGFIAIFILVLVASLTVGFLAHSILRSLKLGLMDNVSGLGLGVVIILAIGSAALSAIQSYPIHGLENTITESTLGSFLANNVDVVLRGLKFIPGDFGT